MSRHGTISITLALLVLTGTFAGIPALGLTGPGGTTFPDPSWPGAASGPGGDTDRPLLWLRAGVFDPIEDPVPTIMGLRGASARGIYLVQFSKTPTPLTGDRLDAVGADVMGYVPENGLAVSFHSTAAVASVALWSDVRWLCPWQDGWKVDPSLSAVRGSILLTVVTWGTNVDISTVLREADARVMTHLLDEYVVEADAGAIHILAGAGTVSWIEPWLPPTFFMDNAATSIGARQVEEGPIDPEGTAMWAFNKTLGFSGLTGESVTIDVTDSGVDGTHQAFSGRMKAFSAIEPGRLQWTDPVGHGTHVAGIVLGDGTYRQEEDQYYHDNFDGKYAGIAPGADLVASSLYGPGINFTYRNITKWSVQQGADISQNSWGSWSSSSWGNYTIVSRDYDNTTRDADWTTPGNQSILVVFAAGNSGIFGNNTMSTSAVAKNVIAVGCTGNGKNVTGVDEVWLHSSRGWSDDGRIKPDLVAPGDAVVSTWATEDTGAGGVLPPEAGAHSYIIYGGTSMAAPVVSGSAALVYDHLRRNEAHSDPSPAVVKSILLASADHLPGYEWPSKEQGWGLVNVSRAVVETRNSNTEFVDQTTKFYNVDDTMTYSYDVQAGTPLRISLVWTDLPSWVYSGKMLINDLDLKVTSPSGKVYKGNWFQGGVSVTGGTADDINNVEMVYLDTPETGEWKVTVTCAQLPPVAGGGNQDFAIAVVGDVNKKFVDLAAQNLSVRATDANEGEVIPISFDIANLGNLPAPSVPWVCNVIDEFGAETKLDGGILDLDPHSGERIQTTWIATRGTHTVKVVPNQFRSIAEESYQNNNKSKTVFIKGFGVTGEVTNPHAYGMPGTDVRFSIDVTNTGNVDDLFLLSRTEPPAGWNVRLDVSFLDIRAGKTDSATLVVSVPEGYLAGETANITVTVVSQGNDTNLIELNTQTSVMEVYSLLVGLDQQSQDARPGDDVVFEFSITNTGNVMTTYSVGYSQTSGPETGVEFDLPRSTFTTPVGGTVSGNLTVSLDADRVQDLPVDGQITFDLRVVAKQNQSVGMLVPGSVIIKQLHKVSITPPGQDTIIVLPGDYMDLILELVNEGNGPDTVTPSMVVPEGWEWSPTEPSIYLQIGEAKTMQLWVTVAASARAGPHTVTALAVVGEDPVSEHRFIFDVDWLPGIFVRLEGPFDRNLTQGEELTLEFRITNVGNDKDSVVVEIAGLTRGLTAEARPIDIDLDVGGIGTFVVVFNATSDAELLRGTYRVFFKYADEVERVTIQLNITIKQKTAPPDPNGPDDGDDDDGGLFTLILAAIIAVVVIIVLAIALTTFARRKRDDSKAEEAFFKSKDDSVTSQVLQEEMSTRRVPPPSPPPPSEPVASPPEEAGAWEESKAETPVAETPPEPMPVRGGTCPDCGNAMEPLGPGSAGLYCPMCGHKEEGG